MTWSWDCRRSMGTIGLSKTAKRRSESHLTKRVRETSCCSRVRATRTRRFCAIARLSSTIARRRERFCAARGFRSSRRRSNRMEKGGAGNLCVAGAISYPEGLRLKLKQSPLETECGGEWRKWLKRWVSRCPRGSTPWPGWPVCRLILVPFSRENCLSPYAVRVTMDTVLLPGLWLRAQRPGWWRATVRQNTRRKFAQDFLLSRTRSAGCIAWPHALARFGGKRSRDERSGAWRGRSARPPQKKFWRRSWARGSAF